MAPETTFRFPPGICCPARHFDNEQSHNSLTTPNTGGSGTLRLTAKAGQKLRARLSGSEISQAEGDRVERPDVGGVVVLCIRDHQPLTAVKFERFRSAVGRVHEPKPRDAIVFYQNLTKIR